MERMQELGFHHLSLTALGPWTDQPLRAPVYPLANGERNVLIWELIGSICQDLLQCEYGREYAGETIKLHLLVTTISLPSPHNLSSGSQEQLEGHSLKGRVFTLPFHPQDGREMAGNSRG